MAGRVQGRYLMPRPVRGWDEQDAFTGWRRYLFWQRGELRRIKARANRRDRRRARWARRADGGLIPPYDLDADSIGPVILSPGELYPACCPGLVIVDHDNIGPAALLIQHHRQAHGRPIAWHTDTPADDAPTGRPGTGDRESNAGG